MPSSSHHFRSPSTLPTLTFYPFPGDSRSAFCSYQKWALVFHIPFCFLMFISVPLSGHLGRATENNVNSEDFIKPPD